LHNGTWEFQAGVEASAGTAAAEGASGALIEGYTVHVLADGGASATAENNINERTLQRAFLEHYGITAKSYAKAHRLNHVFKILSASDSSATRISDIASNHGFWHMSQFAADYRLHFGELPSETLNVR